MFLSLTSDITMAHFGPDAKAADDWFAAMRDVLAANVGNELFGSEVESLSELLNMGPGNMARFLSGLTDTMIPGAGVRSALNDVLTPQLMDVENNFLSYLANRNRWITRILSWRKLLTHLLVDRLTVLSTLWNASLVVCCPSGNQQVVMNPGVSG